MKCLKDSRTTVQVSENGWTKNKIGLYWLKEVFDRYTSPSQGNYWMLILDGHGSHISLLFIDYCHENKIIALCLSSHFTHFLQSLDVSVFSPFSRAYKRQLHAHSQYGAAAISKVDFLTI